MKKYKILKTLLALTLTSLALNIHAITKEEEQEHKQGVCEHHDAFVFFEMKTEHKNLLAEPTVEKITFFDKTYYMKDFDYKLADKTDPYDVLYRNKKGDYKPKSFFDQKCVDVKRMRKDIKAYFARFDIINHIEQSRKEVIFKNNKDFDEFIDYSKKIYFELLDKKYVGIPEIVLAEKLRIVIGYNMLYMKDKDAYMKTLNFFGNTLNFLKLTNRWIYLRR